MSTVNDVTRLNPIPVFAVATPTTTQEVVEALQNTQLPVSIGGGHFSMGGHTASPGTLHLDMRRMNRVLFFDPQNGVIRVQAGTRWCDIQRFIDPHGFAVKIMQTYANFTVGGALSVNAHGRYMGLGPVVLSVRQITLVLADGSVVQASSEDNRELFYAAIGGYGGIGIITEVELDLASNTRVERQVRKLDSTEYGAWFDANVQGRAPVIFHNFDLYPPHYQKGRAVSWVVTDKPASAPRLQPLQRRFWLARYLLWAITETPLGKFRRQYFYDPLLHLSKPVHWRNYEAGYDVAELEPIDRERRTYVLQEYFVPVARFDDFNKAMAETLKKYRVNAVNVSVRHASGDEHSLMAWARGETFAFVLYYKQRTRDNARERVAVWTRELIDRVLEVGGTYYLPYQLHASHAQFHRAYPRARELFALKARLDPSYRLRGALWDRYYQAEPQPATVDTQRLFATVYGDTASADRFYTFLQNIFNVIPEDRLHTLIKRSMVGQTSDEGIYRNIQAGLGEATPALAMLTHALPSLAIQKKVMADQAARLIETRGLRDYVEIGTTGRYVNALKKALQLKGQVILAHDKAPTNSPVDIVERGQLGKVGGYLKSVAFEPLDLPPASADLVSCFVGLHHMPPEALRPFLASVANVLRPGGYFIVRDHDVTDLAMDSFVALAHTVFNAGLGETWETNRAEPRFFNSVAYWVENIEACGMRHTGLKLLQDGDPSQNVLMAFVKEGAPA